MREVTARSLKELRDSVAAYKRAGWRVIAEDSGDTFATVVLSDGSDEVMVSWKR